MILNDGKRTLVNQHGTSAVDITVCSLNMTTECYWDVLPLSFSDHLPILTTVSTVTQSRKRFGKARWCFKIADWDEFEQEIDKVLTQQDPQSCTIDAENKVFTDALMTAARLHIPKGSLTGKVWWSDEAARAVEERASARRAYKDDPS